MLYALTKLAHIGALIFWIGPALGSWLVLRRARLEKGENWPANGLIYRVFISTLVIEHIAFVVLLVTGVVLAHSYGWWPAEWLRWKLWLVVAVLIPFEVVDVYLGNWKLSQFTRRRAAGVPLSQLDHNLVRFYHGPFTWSAIVVLPVTVFVILFLAVAKSTTF